MLKTFIYYRKNEEAEPDVAAVRAKSLNAAVEILGKYYADIDKNNDIFELDFENGANKDVIIISDY